MPEIKDRHFFYPDENFTKSWLATRKGGYSIGQSTQRPGLFETSSFKMDKNWFWFATSIEILAVAITIYGGINKGGKYLGLAIAAVLFFIVLDYVGAQWVHKRHWIVQRLRNQKVVTSATSHASIDRQIKSKRGMVYAGTSFILLSAFLKLAALFLITSLALMFYGIFSLLYIIVIYAHIKHTGYYFAEKASQSELNKQHGKFTDAYLMYEQDQCKIDEVPFLASADGVKSAPFSGNGALDSIDTPIEFGEEHIAKGKPHQLIKTGDDKFVIISNGLLLDKDIKKLCNGQAADAQSILSKECINLQLNQCPIK